MKKSILFLLALFSVTMTTQAAYYYRGDKNSWGTGIQLTQSADGYYYYYEATAGAHNFKILNNATSWSATQWNENNILSLYNGTDVAVTKAGSDQNIKCSATTKHYILFYPKNTKLNGSTNDYICASKTLPNGFGAIHFKHPWNGGSWIYQTATNNGDGTFSYVGKYGGAGVNWCVQKNGTGEKYIATPTLVGSPVTGDDCTFTFNGADQTVTITKKVNKNIGDIIITMNCTQQPKIFFWDVEGKTCAEWPGEDMVAAGANTYTYTFEDVDVDLGVNYKINLKAVNENEWATGDLHTTADVTHSVADLNIPQVAVMGVNNWGDGDKMAVSDDYLSASVTLTLNEIKKYDLKLKIGEDWKGHKDQNHITRAATSSVFKDNDGNGSVDVDFAGDYVFTYTYKTQTLEVTYPELPTPEYKDITIQVYAKQVPNIWWWNGGDNCPSTEDIVNPSTGNTYQWNEAPAMEKVAGEDNWYTKTFTQVDITKGGIKFKLQSTDHSTSTTNEVVTTEDKCYDARVIATVTETTCGELPSGEVPTVTYNVTVPTGTPACYIAGAMNGWSHQAMTKVDETHYTITIEGAQKTQEYKYSASNNWDCVELNEDGSEKSNRTWTENDVVAKWATPAAPVPTTYTVAGDSEAAFGTTWDPTNAANDMVLEGDLYKWTKTNVALSANTEIKFQVVKNHDWSAGQWPGSGNDWVLNTITEDGLYTITITFKEDDKTINATANKTSEVVTKDFSNQPATLYFHPSFHWTSDAAHFAAYFYNNGPGADATPTWVNMTDGDGDGIYEVANAKQHEYVIICRMNPARTENNWDEDKTWNQIESGITIPNTAGDLNTCLAFWTNCQGDVPTSECTWVAPTPLTDKNWADFVATYAGKTINAVVERSFKSGQLHTLCLPFDLQRSWLGDGAKAYQITNVVSRTAEELELKTTQCNSLLAGQPYIIQPIKGEEYEHIIVSNVTVENVTASEYTVLGGGCKVTMQAVSATDGTQTDGSTEYYIGAKDGKLYKEATNKLGLRALVVMTDTEGQALSVRARVVVGENEATGIEDLFTTDAPVKVIENGQLIIIRNGEKFNVQGQKL